MLMPFKGEMGLRFPEASAVEQFTSSSDTLEKTNHPNFVNYEQTVIVTDHQAVLTSGNESEMTATVHSNSNK